MTMLEKLTKIVWDSNEWSYTEAAADVARAVLTALREPDEGMIRAAYVAAVEEFYALPDETALDSVRRRLGVVSWQAQIDSILNEKAASL